MQVFKCNRYLLWLFFVLITSISCKKDITTPINGNINCELSIIKGYYFGNEVIDSLFYTNGKISHVIYHNTVAAPYRINYTYFGHDSIQITENNQYSTVYYFDAQHRLSGVRNSNNNQILRFNYSHLDDSIRFSFTNEFNANAVFFRSTQGNITYVRGVEQGKIYEYHYTYDDKPNAFINLFHKKEFEQLMSMNNQKRILMYEDGVLQKTIDYHLDYTATNQLASKRNLDSTFHANFIYRCP